MVHLAKEEKGDTHFNSQYFCKHKGISYKRVGVCGQKSGVEGEPIARTFEAETCNSFGLPHNLWP